MLVTDQRYRIWTGDTTTSVGVVEAALANAQAEVETWLCRPLESASRTETIVPHGDGRLYPRATPITVAPSGYSVDGAALIGPGGWIGPSFTLNGLGGVTVTYTGGWTTATVPAPIERAIAEAAHEQLQPGATPQPGVASMSVGDASITYQHGSAGASATRLSPRVLTGLRPYRRNRVAADSVRYPWPVAP